MIRPWFRAAFALFAVGWGANQFTSLLLAYRHYDGLSAAVTDVLFGTYALGLVPTLLVIGPVSDRVGRLRMARAAVVTSGLATVVLMLGHADTQLLYPGRLLAGVASGLVFAPGTAWVKELSAYDPGASTTVGARRAAVALSAGFGLGPLVAGVIAQWAPAPLISPYIAHLVVATAAGVLVWRAPETVRAGTPAVPIRAMVAVVTSARFTRSVVPLAPFVFVAASVSLTIGPALVIAHTGSWRYAFAGVVAGLTLGTGVVVQPLARRLDQRNHRVGPAAGLGLVATGAVVETVTAVTHEPAVALLAALLLGAGYGFCLVGGLLETQRIATADELAALNAVFYALTYVGFATPIVLAELSRFASYPSLLLGVAALAALVLATSRRRPTS